MRDLFGFCAVLTITAVLFVMGMAAVNVVFVLALILAILMLPFFIAGFKRAWREGR